MWEAERERRKIESGWRKATTVKGGGKGRIKEKLQSCIRKRVIYSFFQNGKKTPEEYSSLNEAREERNTV